MIKVITWFRRKPGTTVAEFQEYWRNEHPKVVLKLPGLVKYVQNHVLDSQYQGREPFVDGIAETWWESREVTDAQRGTPALAALFEDEERFMNPAGRESARVEQVVVVDGAIPLDPVKIITWVKRRDDLTVDAAQRHWRTQHAAIASKLPGLARYVQNHARYGRTEGSFIGLPMTWFAGFDQVRANARSPELAVTRQDEANFLDTSHVPFVLVREHHII